MESNTMNSAPETCPEPYKRLDRLIERVWCISSDMGGSNTRLREVCVSLLGESTGVNQDSPSLADGTLSRIETLEYLVTGLMDLCGENANLLSRLEEV